MRQGVVMYCTMVGGIVRWREGERERDLDLDWGYGVVIKSVVEIEQGGGFVVD